MVAPIRILHVEDDVGFAELTGEYLERLDDEFVVESAHEVSEGLDRVRTDSFDCIVSDYDLPKRNGIEFLETLRTEQPKVPFILFTGKGSETVASEAISKGVTDYLQKQGGTDQYELLSNRIRNAVNARRAEQQAELWARAVEAANEGIAVVGADGRYVKMNQTYADLYGVDPSELIGESWVTTVPETEVERLQNEVFPMLDAENWSDESVGKRVNDSVYPKLLSLATLDDGGHVCVIRDISDLKARDEEIREKAAKLDVLFEQSPDLIDVHDAEGQLIEVNRRLCEELGYTEAELLEKHVWEIDRMADPETTRELWASMEPGQMRELEGRYQRQDGTTFPVEVHVAQIDLKGAEQYFVIARKTAE
jgi:PAS domain S-box-containing protein